MHVAYCTAFMSLFPILIRILRPSSGPEYRNKGLTARMAIWMAIYISSASALLFSLLLLPTPKNMLSVGFTMWEGIGITAASLAVIVYDKWFSIRPQNRERQQRKDKLALGVYVLFYFLLVFFGGLRPRSVTPRSGARLSDLDQGAALVFAASYVGFQWMGEMWSGLRRLGQWWRSSSLDGQSWVDWQRWFMRWLKGNSSSATYPSDPVCQQHLSAVPSSIPQALPLGGHEIDIRSGVQIMMPSRLQPVHIK
jgi:hypothetical protein